MTTDQLTAALNTLHLKPRRTQYDWRELEADDDGDYTVEIYTTLKNPMDLIPDMAQLGVIVCSIGWIEKGWWIFRVRGVKS